MAVFVLNSTSSATEDTGFARTKIWSKNRYEQNDVGC